MAERLTFVGDAMPYASMLAAEHLSRYALVKDLCLNRRVLDIACGEGYGSALMKSWGASAVVGVDISHEAVANAQSAFGGDGIEFWEQDASKCESLLGKLGTFDLIVCFETLEHVEDVEGMLRGFKALSSESTAIVISCPNDSAVIADAPNEFHLKVYSFEEFRATVTPSLGEPSDWAFGTSVIGFGSFSADTKMLASPPLDIRGLMQQQEVKVAAALPAQQGHEVETSNAAYYVAAWNCTLSTAIVAAPISFKAYESPWNNWIASKAEAESLREALQSERRLRIAADVATGQLKEEIDQSVANASSHEAHLRRTVSAMRRLNDETVGRWRAESFEFLRRTEQLQWAEQRAKLLDQIERSRWHRMGLKYYSLYERPIIGKLLRRARQIVAAIRRI